MKLSFIQAAVFGLADIKAGTSAHPNQMKFEGVLVRLDEPSTKPPNGSRGHKIMIPKVLAEAKLNTLIGMGINYASDLTKHEPTKKVGVIDKAWIEANAIKVSGHIWKRDFPEVVKDLKKPNLGMSFEASNIDVKDDSATVWELSDLCFTGASILYKHSAAYFKTSAIAASASNHDLMILQLIKTEEKGDKMSVKNKIATSGKKLSASTGTRVVSVEDLTKALTVAITRTQKPVLAALQANSDELTELREFMQASAVETISAKSKKKKKDMSDDDDEDEDIESSFDEDVDIEAGDDDSDEDSEEDEDIAASDEESEDIEAGMDDDEDDDVDDLESDLAMDDQKPGKLNSKIQKNKGSKTTVTLGRDKHKSVSATALARLDRKVTALIASNSKQKQTIGTLRRKLEATEQSVQAAGAATTRKSISAGLAALLAKGNVDTSLLASGESKISVADFDRLFENSHVSHVEKLSIKSEAAKLGFMDEGHINKA